MHIRETPLDDVAKLLEVDPKVDTTEDSVLAFFHLVLAVPTIRPEYILVQKGVLYIYCWMSLWFVRTDMSLLSSFTGRPTRPARSSSLRLYVHDNDKRHYVILVVALHIVFGEQFE